MIDQEKTGSFIAQVRKTIGLTQKELADKLSLSDKTISKWETGHGMPDVSVIPELCEILQISANELLAGESLDTSDSFSKKALKLAAASNMLAGSFGTILGTVMILNLFQ